GYHGRHAEIHDRRKVTVRIAPNRVPGATDAMEFLQAEAGLIGGLTRGRCERFAKQTVDEACLAGVPGTVPGSAQHPAQVPGKRVVHRVQDTGAQPESAAFQLQQGGVDPFRTRARRQTNDPARRHGWSLPRFRRPAAPAAPVGRWPERSTRRAARRAQTPFRTLDATELL